MQTLTLEQPSVSRLANRHSIGLSAGYHLLPGLLTGVVYSLLALPVVRLGMPSLVAMMVAGVLVIIPIELGGIAWAAWKSPSGARPFMEKIGDRERNISLDMIDHCLANSVDRIPVIRFIAGMK